MKTIYVSEAYKLYGMASLIVSDDSPLEYIVSKFATEPEIRGVFIVDSSNRLSGVITRIHILKWLYLKLYGSKERYEITVTEFYRIIDANKAKDLAPGYTKELCVKETDSLQIALDKMLKYKEDVLPVVDREGMILGDLRLSELLLKAFEAGKEKLG